jgi:hypothetical protein
MEETMATAELDNQALETLTSDERVTKWRLDQLREAGYSDAVAARLAARTDIDLHVAVDLMRAGCPVEVALRILC